MDAGGSSPGNDPQFVEPIAASETSSAAGNYRLEVSSPAIDAGGGTHSLTGTGYLSPRTDLDGLPRVGAVNSQTVSPDIGAYEMPYCADLSFAFLYPGLDPAADANLNGVSNLIEYAAGLVPHRLHSSAVSALPQVLVSDGGGVELVVTTWQPSDVQLVFEVSADLGENWQPFTERFVRGTDYNLRGLPALPEMSRCAWRLAYTMSAGVEGMFFRYRLISLSP